jgi:hypothetical protein
MAGVEEVRWELRERARLRERVRVGEGGLRVRGMDWVWLETRVMEMRRMRRRVGGGRGDFIFGWATSERKRREHGWRKRQGRKRSGMEGLGEEVEGEGEMVCLGIARISGRVLREWLTCRAGKGVQRTGGMVTPRKKYFRRKIQQKKYERREEKGNA